MDPRSPAEAQPMPAPPGFPSPDHSGDRPTSLPEPPHPDQPRVQLPSPRVGQLSPGWRLAFGVGWGAIVAGNAAVWESSRVIGLSTWWLGADSEPRFLLLQLLPFYGPLLVTAAAISNWRYAPYLGIAAGAFGAAIGVGDLNRVRWIAVVELVIAGAALCISVASLAGMYRAVCKPEATARPAS